MDAAEILGTIVADLAYQLQWHEPQLPASIPAISPSVAAALLQKSIRRGRTDLALAAAIALLRAAPDRLWRRLSIIAVEDIGLGDIDVLYTTIGASAHRRRLARRLGERRLVNLVVSQLASAPKCRAGDDLLVVTTDCPAWDTARLELAEVQFGDLLDVVVSDAPIERRAIAQRWAMGGESMAEGARRGCQRPGAVFDHLCEAGYPHTLVEISREAYRQTREPFCAFLPLLHREFAGGAAELVSDDFPAEKIIGGLPGWVFDRFSNKGRAALTCFLKSDNATTNWLRLHVAPSDRMAALGHAVFRVESGLVADRLIWPIGVSLRRQADLESWPFTEDDAATLLQLLRADVGVLNAAREVSYGR